MNAFRNLCGLAVCVGIVSGCAGGAPSIRQPWCAIGGAVIGGGAGWAINEEALDNDDGDAASAAVGAAIGAALASALCPAEKPPEPVAAAPEPVKTCAADGDGDGVFGDAEVGCPDKCPNTPEGVDVDSDGCPKVGETLLVLKGVNFAFDSARLTPESEAILDQAVSALQDAGSVSVQVEGHTDSVGSEHYNQRLSERRAEAVVDHLISQGIDATRLEPIGMGESQPVAPNDTSEGRYENRRVEFEVSSK